MIVKEMTDILRLRIEGVPRQDIINNNMKFFKTLNEKHFRTILFFEYLVKNYEETTKCMLNGDKDADTVCNSLFDAWADGYITAAETEKSINRKLMEDLKDKHNGSIH